MSAIEKIEQLIEQLPSDDFQKLVTWLETQKARHATEPLPLHRPAEAARSGPSEPPLPSPPPLRDHSAFLNSFAPEDEGLYDDAATR